MRFDVGVILAVIALLLAILMLAGFGGPTMLGVAILLLSLAYLLPAFAGRTNIT